jgi:hypothetical protein
MSQQNFLYNYHKLREILFKKMKDRKVKQKVGTSERGEGIRKG